VAGGALPQRVGRACKLVASPLDFFFFLDSERILFFSFYDGPPHRARNSPARTSDAQPYANGFGPSLPALFPCHFLGVSIGAIEAVNFSTPRLMSRTIRSLFLEIALIPHAWVLSTSKFQYKPFFFLTKSAIFLSRAAVFFSP